MGGRGFAFVAAKLWWDVSVLLASASKHGVLCGVVGFNLSGTRNYGYVGEEKNFYSFTLVI